MAESIELPSRLAILPFRNKVLLPGAIIRIRCTSPSRYLFLIVTLFLFPALFGCRENFALVLIFQFLIFQFKVWRLSRSSLELTHRYYVILSRAKPRVIVSSVLKWKYEQYSLILSCQTTR